MSNAISDAEQDINDLAKIHSNYWKEPRYQILKKFCEGSNNIISIGCGVKEPIIIGATTATDITPLAEKHLRSAGWKGKFVICKPYEIPFGPKEFDIAVCSEVIEHLEEVDQIRKTFEEIDRISKKWIITTPNSKVIAPANQNPTHKWFFDDQSIRLIVPKGVQISFNDHHIYLKKV